MKTPLRLTSYVGTALILGVFLTGCDSKLSEMARTIQQDLGVEIKLNTPDTDGCATQQVADLISEFASLSRDNQNALKAKMASEYKLIAINATETSQTLWGEQYVLAYGDVSKSVNDDLKSDGIEPTTQITKATGTLALTARDALHKETVYAGETSAGATFEAVRSPAEYKEALRLGSIKQNHVLTEPHFDCGTMAQLKDLL